MKLFLKTLTKLCVFVLLFYPQWSMGNALGSEKTALIEAVDLSGRTLQIGKTMYILSDQLIVLDAESGLRSRADLQAGENIKFWYTAPESSPGNPSGLLEIHKIIILTNAPKKIPT